MDGKKGVKKKKKKATNLWSKDLGHADTGVILMSCDKARAPAVLQEMRGKSVAVQQILGT